MTSGSEDDAASSGLVLFGTWAVLGWLGKAAGVFTGSYMAAVTIWNAAVAASCYSDLGREKFRKVLKCCNRIMQSIKSMNRI